MAFHVWKKALGCTTFHPHWKAFFNPKAPLLAQKHDALRLIAPHYTSVAKHEGAVYVVLGGSAQTGTGPLDHPAMVTTAGTPGSLVLDIDGNRLDATFLDGTGAVRDSFTLQKGRLGAATPSSRTAVLNAAPDAPVLAAPLAGATSAQAQSPLFTFAQISDAQPRDAVEQARFEEVLDTLVAAGQAGALIPRPVQFVMFALCLVERQSLICG